MQKEGVECERKQLLFLENWIKIEIHLNLVTLASFITIGFSVLMGVGVYKVEFPAIKKFFEHSINVLLFF